MEPGIAVDVRHPEAIHVVEDGPRTAPVLLLIHGTAGSVAWWHPLLPALARQHHVVRVDLPGHGQSPPAPSYAVSDQARRVGEVLDDLRADSVAAVGHSSGGFVATALAEQRPDVVRVVGLINTGPRADALLPQGLLNRLVSTPALGRLIWAARSEASIRRGLQTAFTRPVEIPDSIVASVRDMTYRAFTTAPRESLAYITQRSIPARLAALDTRVLVIFGTEDRRWRSVSAQAYHGVQNARVELLPGIGHTPMFEAPQITSDLIIDFANDIAASGRPRVHPRNPAWRACTLP
jgi:pimeloyl-ACP methyl ester carboxylesterase